MQVGGLRKLIEYLNSPYFNSRAYSPIPESAQPLIKVLDYYIQESSSSNIPEASLANIQQNFRSLFEAHKNIQVRVGLQAIRDFKNFDCQDQREFFYPFMGLKISTLPDIAGKPPPYKVLIIDDFNQFSSFVESINETSFQDFYIGEDQDPKEFFLREILEIIAHTFYCSDTNTRIDLHTKSPVLSQRLKALGADTGMIDDLKSYLDDGTLDLFLQMRSKGYYLRDLTSISWKVDQLYFDYLDKILKFYRSLSHDLNDINCTASSAKKIKTKIISIQTINLQRILTEANREIEQRHAEGKRINVLSEQVRELTEIKNKLKTE
jgi:hypothetical protein